MRILADLGDMGALYETAARAMDDFPNQALAAYYFGLAANALGKPQEAQSPLEQAVLMTGADLRLRLDVVGELAQSLLLQKEYQKAAARLESVLPKGGDQHPGILERYGDAQLGLGNREKALEYWKKAQTLQPSPRLTQKLNN
jgi:tetratricopeptide (TPR) repeat protein